MAARVSKVANIATNRLEITAINKTRTLKLNNRAYRLSTFGEKDPEADNSGNKRFQKTQIN